jgi:hypothetical protein
MIDVRKKQLSSYHAAIRLEGEELLADFPELIDPNKSGEDFSFDDEKEWLEGARESLLEWMKEQGEQLPVRPKRFVVKRGERRFDLPLS